MAKADLIIKRQDAQNIYFGDTLLKDGHAGRTFTYCLSNPPFGQEWKVQEKSVKAERERDGDEGRFAAGLPSVSDGAMLFLQHLVSKMRPASQEGGRGAIVLNGSALFTGAAGSGPSEIRRWLLENDLVDAIIGLPTDIFYNTGIATYIWVLDNHKPEKRRGKVQLIDATEQWVKMRKSVGAKRRMLSPTNIETIVNLYGDFEDADPEVSKIFNTEDFGYRTITVEQPLRQVFSVGTDRIDQALAARQVAALDKDHRHDLRTALETLEQGRTWTNEADFMKVLGPALGAHGVTLKPAVHKAVVAAFAESSPDGMIVKTTRGKIEPDPSLRDTENVPLTEDVDAYVKREVLPGLPRHGWTRPNEDRLRDPIHPCVLQVRSAPVACRDRRRCAGGHRSCRRFSKRSRRERSSAGHQEGRNRESWEDGSRVQQALRMWKPSIYGQHMCNQKAALQTQRRRPCGSRHRNSVISNWRLAMWW